MWSDWRPDVVDADLKQLAEAGLQVLRVFPLWPDFQPITQLYDRRRAGRMRYRHGEAPLPDDEAGRAGVSAEALARFAEFADLAEQHGLKLIVGLVTGWMSGRLFVPPALEGRNVLTDPVAIMWQVRFVAHFVRRFRDHPAILAWDLGNECNCMAPGATPRGGVGLDRRHRQRHPRRGPRPARSSPACTAWTAGPRTAAGPSQDQAELTDVLTTHPYPYFTPHCDQDPVNTIRTVLHATAESRWYADSAASPCLAEEIGTLGPMVASERSRPISSATCLFSLWAHDCHGLALVVRLRPGPSDPRALRLARRSSASWGCSAPTAARSRCWRDRPLPPRSWTTCRSARCPRGVTEAVCILTHEQDQWGAAYSSFVLAKQAGFDLEFQYDDQPLKRRPLPAAQRGRRRQHVAAHVARAVGARPTTGRPSTSRTTTACSRRSERRSGWRCRRGAAGWVRWSSVWMGWMRPSQPTRRSAWRSGQPAAEVLGREADGNPIFTRASVRHGPDLLPRRADRDLYLANRPGGFHRPDAAPWWRHLPGDRRSPSSPQRAVQQTDPFVNLTEHPLDHGQRIVIAINYSPEPREVALEIPKPWIIDESWYAARPAAGAAGWQLRLAPNDAAVFTVIKKGDPNTMTFPPLQRYPVSSHLLPQPVRHRRPGQGRLRLRRLAGRGQAAALAGAAARPHRLRRLALPVLFRVRRQPAADQPGRAGLVGAAAGGRTGGRAGLPRAPGGLRPGDRSTSRACSGAASSTSRPTPPPSSAVGFAGVPRAKRELAGRLRAVHGAEGALRRRKLARLAARYPACASRARWPTTADRSADEATYHEYLQWLFADQWGSAEGARQRARHPDHRRHPDLRGRGQRGCVGAARAVPPRRRGQPDRDRRACRPTTSRPPGSAGATRTTAGM